MNARDDQFCGYCVTWGEPDENGEAIAYDFNGNVIPPELIASHFHRECEESVMAYIEEVFPEAVYPLDWPLSRQRRYRLEQTDAKD